MTEQIHNENDAPGEPSFNQLQENIGSLLKYIRSKSKWIYAAGILFGVLGLVYSFVKSPMYTAESSFVLDNNSASSMGSLASLAALAGVNVDNGSGVFSGDNIIELYRSRSLLESTLLTSAKFETGEELLVNRYIQHNSKWKKLADAHNIRFSTDTQSRTRQADSVLYEIVKEVRKKSLNVEKLEKKTVITVQVMSKDELFAKNFNERLVENVNQLFVKLRSAKAMVNVQVLQKQTDSVRRQLNANLSGAAAATDAVPYANPLELSLKVPSQRKSADLQANSGVYGELIKNLELAKISLLRETPLIQYIDKPELPLEKEKISKIIYTLTSAIIGIMLAAFYFAIKGLFFLTPLTDLNWQV